ncbi:jg12061 [Pararge aegeria aegeria]|uniref:Jg12061 protein n=1 Tax=Pararge aegeria aegeria TaxID=348720 RepID=A0A8S4RJ76_9NEOP|nr:jg12061 [Pararge aegeria aegeria]
MCSYGVTMDIKKIVTKSISNLKSESVTWPSRCQDNKSKVLLNISPTRTTYTFKTRTTKYGDRSRKKKRYQPQAGQQNTTQ